MGVLAICDYKLQKMILRRSYFFAVMRKIRSKLKRRSIRLAILCVTIIYLCLFLTNLRIKAGKARKVVAYVNKYQHFVSEAKIRRSPHFGKFLRDLKAMTQPPFLLLLNNHALNITFNHLCNTLDMENVHARIAIVALDQSAYLTMSRRYPRFKYFLFDAEKLQRRIRGEYSALSSYQLFFLFRANLAAVLAKTKLSFWMTQQDTLWRSNLVDFNLEERFSLADVIVDRIGNDQMTLYEKRDQWINGATYFVRGGWRSAGFFELLSTRLKQWCAPDSAIMTYLCMTAEPNGVLCSWVPHSIMASSDWLYTDRSRPPHFLQIDHLRSDEKMEVFHQYGLNFLSEDDSVTCNRSAVENAQQLLKNGTLFADRHFPLSARISEFFLDVLLTVIPYGSETYRKYMFLFNYGERL